MQAYQKHPARSEFWTKINIKTHKTPPEICDPVRANQTTQFTRRHRIQASKIHLSLKQCCSVYENKVVQLMSAWQGFVKVHCFHKLKMDFITYIYIIESYKSYIIIRYVFELHTFTLFCIIKK